MYLLFAFYIVIFHFSFYFFHFPAFAQEMSSPNYKIQGGNFSMTSGTTTSSNYTLSDIVGETAAGQFASKGYIVNSGFQNTAVNSALAFSVSPQLIDFGDLHPNKPIERVVVLKVTTGDGSGYTLRVSEDHPLSTVSGAEIPDTPCTFRGVPCTFSAARRWLPQDAPPGLGFTMTGTHTPKDFLNDTYYRPFPAIIHGDPPTVIMENTSANSTHEAIMKLKVITAGSQPVGIYRNAIIFNLLGGI